MKKIIIFLIFFLFLNLYFVLGHSMTFYESFDNQTSFIENGCTKCNATNFAPGIMGNAAFFDEGGQSYYLNQNWLKYPISGRINPDEGSVSFWVKPMNFSGGFFDLGWIGTPGDYFGVFQNGGNCVYLEYRSMQNGSVKAGGQMDNCRLKKNDWNYITVVWKANSGSDFIAFYFNGSLVKMGLLSEYNLVPDENYFTVGISGFYGNARAYMDELKIYDYAKSPEEVLADYKGENYSYIPPASGEPKPESNGNVKINNSGLFVNNNKFLVKGVGYQPIPIGLSAEYSSHKQQMYNTNKIYKERDFPLLRKMGANTVRTWSEVLNTSFLDAAYNNGNKPIYVLMGFWMNCKYDYSNNLTRQNYINSFKQYVTKYKDYPGVLAWGLGNENNLDYCSGGYDMRYYYSLCNEMAKAAYEIEGENYHPVGIINGDLGGIGSEYFWTTDENLNYLDFWGMNVYRGRSFGNLFVDYSSLTNKPAIITEYGIDSLNNSNLQEYENTQSDWDLALWHEINNSDAAIGATLMAYSDEWWKAGNVTGHNYGGYGTSAIRSPDQYSNEEWWGVMRTVPNPGAIDIMQPRKVYYDLQSEWFDGNMDGDINGDCVVDIFDLAKVGLCFGKIATGTCLAADVKQDGAIDIFDLAKVGINFGDSC